MEINNTVFHGRPEDFDRRLPKEQRVYEMLDSLGIEYDGADHEEAMTIEACHAVEEILGTDICKNLFLCNRQKTDFYLLLIDGCKKFKTSVVSKLIGTARLSFGDHDKMLELLDITPGSLTVFGLMNDPEGKVRLLIDKSVIGTEYFGAHPCINTSSLKLKTSDVLGKVIPFLGHEPTVIDIPEDTDE